MIFLRVHLLIISPPPQNTAFSQTSWGNLDRARKMKIERRPSGAVNDDDIDDGGGSIIESLE